MRHLIVVHEVSRHYIACHKSFSDKLILISTLKKSLYGSDSNGVYSDAMNFYYFPPLPFPIL